MCPKDCEIPPENSFSSFLSGSAIMSFESLTMYKRFLERFLGRFPENNIWFVVYPFFKIFKCSGFCPVGISLEKYPDIVFHRDRKSCFFTIIGFIGITVGFGCGIHVVSHAENLALLRTSTIISYITSWAQIFSLFFLGCVALVTSWTNLRKLGGFFDKIRQIDLALEMTGADISYRAMRKKLFIQTGVSFVIPACLSMVNCTMIRSPYTTSWSCYWFICFAPLLLLTWKELQFYNLMFLLKDKFGIVNQLIGELSECKHPPNGSLSVISKCSDEGVLLVRKDTKLFEQMRALSEIYSDVADCVDVVVDIFASHLLTTICTSFAVITIQSYNLFALVVHSLSMQISDILFTVAWIIVQIMVIGVNVIACSQTSNAMADTGVYLHKLKPREDYGLFLKMVQVFSLEIIHRKKPLTAAGFFDMNFKLFTSIVAAVTTYLIIIIQFHLGNLQQNAARNQTIS